ncbi:MAG: nuclear transport factor 2 family protein [Xanthobacteraceae bacterium]
MTLADEAACADLIQRWGHYRDQRRWPELLSTFHPDGEIAVSWFRGPFAQFVDACKRGGMSKHLLFPSVVRVAGERAVAETNVVILVRQEIDNLAVDMTSRSRFLDRLECRGGEWRILERAAIYEQDRLDPVVPSEAFTRMMQTADVAKYPEPYRSMAFRLAAAGRGLAEPVHHDGAPATDELRARYSAWLERR